MADPADDADALGGHEIKRRGRSKKIDHKVLTVIESAVRWAAHSDGLMVRRGEGRRGRR
jgi:hypothetical protein